MPSFDALAFAFFAVALPLPLLSATPTSSRGLPSGSGRLRRSHYPRHTNPNTPWMSSLAHRVSERPTQGQFTTQKRRIDSAVLDAATAISRSAR